MALTVIVEDGSGVDNANSYASVADAAAYHEANPQGDAWAALTELKKQQGVITATRLLDEQWQWNGYKLDDAQSLQWPRQQCPDPDSINSFRPGWPRPINDGYVREDIVPKAIKDATCAMALLCVTSNREAEAQGQGISSFTLEDVMSVSFDAATAMKVFPASVSNGLAKYGRSQSSRSGLIPVRRV